MYGDRQLGTAELLERLAVEIDVRLEPFRVAADDRQRQGEAVARRPDDRLGTAADADPCAQRPVLDGRIDDLALQRWAGGPAPRHAARFEQLGEEPQFVLEQLVVVGKVVAEERVRLGEGAASENYFGAAVRQPVQRRKAL